MTFWIFPLEFQFLMSLNYTQKRLTIGDPAKLCLFDLDSKAALARIKYKILSICLIHQQHEFEYYFLSDIKI